MRELKISCDGCGVDISNTAARSLWMTRPNVFPLRQDACSDACLHALLLRAAKPLEGGATSLEALTKVQTFAASAKMSYYGSELNTAEPAPAPAPAPGFVQTLTLAGRSGVRRM